MSYWEAEKFVNNAKITFQLIESPPRKRCKFPQEPWQCIAINLIYVHYKSRKSSSQSKLLLVI